MGLDTYAVRIKPNGEIENADPTLFKNVGMLCGGLFSGNGNNGSFRGKVYNDVVKEATGYSLYQELIPPKEVAKLSRAYDKWLRQWGDGDYEGIYGTTRHDELVALGQFFRVCKKHGLGLAGWW